MEKFDVVLVLLIIVLACLATVQEYSYSGYTTIQCDQGIFTVHQSMFGGRPIYKASNDCWWLWLTPHSDVVTRVDRPTVIYQGKKPSPKYPYAY
jgi:hypothetical protein